MNRLKKLTYNSLRPYIIGGIIFYFFLDFLHALTQSFMIFPPYAQELLFFSYAFLGFSPLVLAINFTSVPKLFNKPTLVLAIAISILLFLHPLQAFLSLWEGTSLPVNVLRLVLYIPLTILYIFSALKYLLWWDHKKEVST